MRNSRPRQVVPGALFLRIVGGCEDCDAYTDLLDHGASVFSLAIRHEDTCRRPPRAEGRCP